MKADLLEDPDIELCWRSTELHWQPGVRIPIKSPDLFMFKIKYSQFLATGSDFLDFRSNDIHTRKNTDIATHRVQEHKYSMQIHSVTKCIR